MNIESKKSSLKGILSLIYEQRSITLALLIIIIIITFSSTFTEVYFSFANLSAILINMSIELLVIIGMSLLLISGAFDLSLGSTMALSGIACGYLIKLGVNVPLAIIITFIICIFFGFMNGLIVAKIGVNSFITTLATGIVIKGIAVRIAGPGILRLPENFTALGQKILFRLQMPVWYGVIIAGLFIYLIARTKFFRQYYYIGGNEKAATLSGINVIKLRIIAFIMAATLAGFAGIVSAARFGNAMSEVGTGIELRAITAAVIGGISIWGGVGTIFGSVLGAVFIALLNNGIIVANVNPYWQPIFLGLVLITAVIFDVVVSRRRTE